MKQHSKRLTLPRLFNGFYVPFATELAALRYRQIGEKHAPIGCRYFIEHDNDRTTSRLVVMLLPELGRHFLSQRLSMVEDIRFKTLARRCLLAHATIALLSSAFSYPFIFITTLFQDSQGGLPAPLLQRLAAIPVLLGATVALSLLFYMSRNFRLSTLTSCPIVAIFVSIGAYNTVRLYYICHWQ
jgi:hypothetical protein